MVFSQNTIKICHIVILFEIVRHFLYTTNMKNKAIVGQSVPLINSYTKIGQYDLH